MRHAAFAYFSKIIFSTHFSLDCVAYGQAAAIIAPELGITLTESFGGKLESVFALGKLAREIK